MTTYYLSGQGLMSRSQFHDAITELLSFPEHYGRNLDALHDMLTDIGEESTLIIRDSSAMEENLGTYFHSLQRVFRDAEKENPNFHILYE